MQITRAVVTPVELSLDKQVRFANLPAIDYVTAIFVRIETREGRVAWGSSVAHPLLTGEEPEDVLSASQACADMAPDLHPTNIEYSLDRLGPLVEGTPSALCAFDLAFHDLLGLAADMPLYKLLGGFRNSIQTSATVPIAPVTESVELAKARASAGFRLLKVKGGLDPQEDVRRIQAIHRALPDHIIRLDADGGYSVRQALDVSRVLENILEMIEQPTPAEDLGGLKEVTAHCSVPVIADQSVRGPRSALQFATGRHADGMSIKIASCGGFRCAKQVDAIARAAHLVTMVSCLIEPALLVAAGLSFALSSPNVQYGDLDGFLDMVNDPSVPGFRLEDGCMIASDVPGLGCTVDL